MKKKPPLVFVILLTLLLSTACNLGINTRTVSINDGKESLTIQYKGELFFNAGETAIDEISPGGYVKYRRNNRELIASASDSGHVNYKLYIDERRLDINDSTAKEFFKTAMNEIIDHYQK